MTIAKVPVPPKGASIGFGKGTLVKTIDGVKKIERLTHGDLVQAHLPSVIPRYRQYHYLPELQVQYKPVKEVVRVASAKAMCFEFFSDGILERTNVGLDQCFYVDFPVGIWDRSVKSNAEWKDTLQKFPGWAFPPWAPARFKDFMSFELVNGYFENTRGSPVDDNTSFELSEPLYSLKVADLNTFFVTSLGIWTLGAP